MQNPFLIPLDALLNGFITKVIVTVSVLCISHVAPVLFINVIRATKISESIFHFDIDVQYLFL